MESEASETGLEGRLNESDRSDEVDFGAQESKIHYSEAEHQESQSNYKSDRAEASSKYAKKVYGTSDKSSKGEEEIKKCNASEKKGLVSLLRKVEDGTQKVAYQREYRDGFMESSMRYFKSQTDSNSSVDEGVVALIYHEYQDGSIEAFFERKPKTHPENPNKLTLIGGHKDPTDYNEKKTLERELAEEVENPDALQELFIAFRESGMQYKVIRGYINGKYYKTEIDVIKIDSDISWKKIKKSRLTEGEATFLSLEKIIGKKAEFASGYWNAVMRYFEEYHPSQIRLALHYGNTASPAINSVNATLKYNCEAPLRINLPHNFENKSVIANLYIPL